jgi:hypothetical protein
MPPRTAYLNSLFSMGYDVPIALVSPLPVRNSERRMLTALLECAIPHKSLNC